MSSRSLALVLPGLWFILFGSTARAQQPPPPASAARILLLPRRIVSGERATLAVLDNNGRLTPGANVKFSNGDHLTTDASGRGLFVAPLNPGVIYGSIAGRPGRVATTILAPTDPSLAQPGVGSAPRLASLSDRFDILGAGFCGDADANAINIAGLAAIVLASSPAALVVLPPSEMDPGVAPVEITCGKSTLPAFRMTFLALELHADSSPLAGGEHRRLTVSVEGSTAKISLEAKNLAPEIAEVVGGTLVRRQSSGGADNNARFEVIGKKRGSFLISIRLLTALVPPAR